MNVVLPTELEKRIKIVQRGEFNARDEFFKEAVELLLELRRGYGSPIPLDAH